MARTAPDTAPEVPSTDEVTTDYVIEIQNCNSIDEAQIRLQPGSLNIKYGPNGIGKSTIARALTLQCEEDGALDALTPFKHKATPDGPRPTVHGAEPIKQVMTFNDEYVSTFVFQRDEVLKNSFEIFINTPEYRAGEKLIESKFRALKDTFTDEPEFNEALESFEELAGAFNVTKNGSLAKTSKAFKGIGVGGKLAHIPEPLQGYKGFLESDDPATWITWQAKGKEYLDLSDNCPFCSTTSVDKTVASRVSEEYNSSAVRNLSALRNVIERLGQYFAQDDLQTLTDLTTSISGLTPEQESFVVSLRTAVLTLLSKLSDVKALSFHALKDEEDRGANLEALKIDLKYLGALNSEATRSVVDLINGKLESVISQISDINREIGLQNSRVKKLIRQNQNAINTFLRSAGYRYEVRIEGSGETYRMLLEHADAPGHIESAREHLSYGEKNAFALILFMHDVQHKQPDLVVLDDPVSSFDKTKKFAILHQLFNGTDNLSGTTTLLLTHDIEPAIDIVRTGTARQFTRVKPVVHFLSGRSGVVSEKSISPADISTFSQVCDANIASAADPIIKCIYLRRLYEVHGALDVVYELLSNLLHARPVPSRKLGANSFEPMTQEEINTATASIREHIADFDYSALLADLTDFNVLKAKFEQTQVGYEKVQIFRIMLALERDKLKRDDVFAKFVNETYHIENEYVMQLNPRDYDAVPEFVVNRCTELINAAV